MNEQETSPHETTAILLEERDFLRRIHGTFRTPSNDRLASRCYAVLFGIVLPALFVYALISRGIPQFPLNNDQWACLALAVISPALGIFCWVHADREWHFTGQEISAYRNGKLLWRVPIDSISATTFHRAAHSVFWLRLRTDRRHYSILLVPDLLQRIQSA